MAHTHTMLLYHIVFSTKHREPWLQQPVREPLFAYMAGVFQKLDGQALLINGISDHVHILARLRAATPVAEAVKTVKASSSSWFKDEFRRAAFAWQEGYGAFTVSVSQRERVRKYIAQQEQHHTRNKFEDEYIGLLKRHDVEYDEKFVFD